MKVRENFLQISYEFFNTQEWNKKRIFSDGEALLYLILKKEIKISTKNLGIIFGWSKAKVVLFIHKLIAKGYIKRKIEEKISVLTVIKFLKKENNYHANNKNYNNKTVIYRK